MARVDCTDALDCEFARDGAGKVADVWPAELSGDAPVFPTAAKTPCGIEVTAADRWPATAHREVFYADGVAPRVIDRDAATRNDSAKGTNLAWDAYDGVLHALTAGAHFTKAARCS
jgi:hypothetical protein